MDARTRRVHAAAVATILDNRTSHAALRISAIVFLVDTGPRVLSMYASAVAMQLDDTQLRSRTCHTISHHNAVRRAATDAIGRMEPDAQSAHAAAVALQLDSREWMVRLSAVRALGRMPATVSAWATKI